MGDVINISDEYKRDSNGKFIKGSITRNRLGKESPKKIKIEPELLWSLYWGNQLGTVEISKLFNCEYKVIWRRMLENNIPFRDNYQNQKIREYHHSIEALNKISMAHLGKKKSDEQRKKQSGKNHWNWKGGITKESNRLRHLREWKEWREKIFKRDDYTCQFCCSKGIYLEPHHIFKRSEFPTNVFDMDNGITLCKSCHNLTKWNESNFIELSLMLLNGGV